MRYIDILVPATFLLPIQVSSQLFSCRDIGCPEASFGVANCELDDVKATSLGVSKVNTSLSEDPLTWTVTIGTYNDPATDGLLSYRKDFYLGQPSALELQNSDSIHGCAIFFEGISYALEFGGSLGGEDLAYEDGTCLDALGESCVSDWMAQLQSLVSLIDGELDCEALGQSLQANPPGTCQNLGGSWGQVTSRVIAGSASAGPIQLGSCTPTISKDYGVSHVESFNASVPYRVGTMMYTFTAGITPVMSIFAPKSIDGNISSAGQAINAPETYLNCLKIKMDHDNSSRAGFSSAAGVKVDSKSSLFNIGFYALLLLALLTF